MAVAMIAAVMIAADSVGRSNSVGKIEAPEACCCTDLLFAGSVMGEEADWFSGLCVGDGVGRGEDVEVGVGEVEGDWEGETVGAGVGGGGRRFRW